MLIPEMIFKKYGEGVYIDRLRALYLNSRYKGSKWSLDGLKIIGFISILRHTHAHSRCLVVNIHEVMHNILYLLLFSEIFKDQLILDYFLDLCQNFEEIMGKDIQYHSHINELLCDLLTTALSGFAYPLSLISSDLYRYPIIGMSSTHPPDVIRNYVCLEYANDIMQLDPGYELKKIIENILDLSWHYISSNTIYWKYISFIMGEYKKIRNIISRIIWTPFNEDDLSYSLHAKCDLEKNNLGNIVKYAEEGLYTPITLLNAIWLKRLKERRLVEPNEKLQLETAEKHSIEIFRAMKNWLEEQLIKQIFK